ncbi:MAG: hypothetical protein ACFFCW_44650 [Candidatus Hodarchaeota archaeon]
MKSITSNEKLADIHNRGLGLVYNDFTKSGSADFNILHVARCPQLKKSNVNVDKIFFMSEEEAVSWLIQNRGKEGIGWKRGGCCGARARGQVPPEYATNAIEQSRVTGSVKETTGPFKELEVKRILVNYLRKQGYEIKSNVPCSSGYIDLVAVKEGRSTCVEAKGEDEGGYTSAEMNFQMGLGQIISRMTDPQATYALAIPITDNYMRVIRKYKGSFGLVRLDCSFFLISEDGNVESYTAEGFSKFINGLK